MITNVSSIFEISDDVLNNSDAVVPLDDFLLQAIAKNTVSSQQDKADVMTKLQEIQTTSDPAKLFDLQQRTSDYNLKMSLFATLARKAVGAVETVVRA